MFIAIHFLYGAFLGAVVCLTFFVLVFRKVTSLMEKTIRKKALKHAAFDAVAKEAAQVPPSKVETLCRLVCFDNDIVGEAVLCRCVLLNHTLHIYRIEQVLTLPDHRQKVLKETLLGKINSYCVETTGKKISKYHRHVNSRSRYASVKGKCTVLTAKEGSPLFIPFLDKLLEMHLSNVARDKKHHHHHTSPAHLRSSPDTSHALTDGGGEARPLDYGITNLFMPDSVKPKGFASYLKNTFYGENAAGEHTYSIGSDKTAPTVAEVSTWRCIAIKFPTRRENERWMNLLQSNERTDLWNHYLTHMPCKDIFNVLVARLFFENTTSNRLHDILTKKIQEKFEALAKTLGQNVKGKIFLESLTIGGEVPLFNNVSEAEVSTCGDLEFAFDVLYRGGLVLAVRFSITYRDIKVPDITFTIKVLELAGRMRLNVGPPHTKKFWLGCPQPPELRLEITQNVQSEGFLATALSLLPDLSSIISNVLREKIFEDMILPNYDFFPWVSFDDHFKEEEEEEEEESDKEGTVASSKAAEGETKSTKGSEKSESKKERKERKKREKSLKKQSRSAKGDSTVGGMSSREGSFAGTSPSHRSPSSKKDDATEWESSDEERGSRRDPPSLPCPLPPLLAGLTHWPAASRGSAPRSVASRHA
ncbi:hypothetical protein AGDE_07404 [Angomonas deanei]|uniref:SMP-LTD domain-containing protein n=1 Tax=Angomonas deanei TaxID=59799 RepID=A0A7G2CH79_9TRYP|nr:hypothetical protein AGDE_07404 [Angomonas deanei]CAD2219190.1 hypothetical protein, conserved [Angomonas deanei]|eukprot:EPY35380.1 hypothetical protein AGDE_07404 [Angomonas deanei]